jgi:hypothetical protein
VREYDKYKCKEKRIAQEGDREILKKRKHYEEIMLGYHGYGRIFFHTPTYPSLGVFFIIASVEMVFGGVVSFLSRLPY